MSASEDNEILVLRNNNFAQNHKCRLLSFLHSEELSDVTLACQGQILKAHRIVLAACSPFFAKMFTMCGERDPIVVMNEVKGNHLKALLQYMYTGESEVLQDEIEPFLKLADTLHILGLYDNTKLQTGAGSIVTVSAAAVGETASSNAVTPPLEEVVIKQEPPDDDYLNFEDHTESRDASNTRMDPLTEQGNSYHASQQQSSHGPAPKRRRKSPHQHAKGDSSYRDDSMKFKESGNSSDSEEDKNVVKSCISHLCSTSTEPAAYTTSKKPKTDPTPSTSHTRGDDSQAVSQCHICKNWFPNESDMHRHCSNVHNFVVGGVPCPICNRTYKNESTMKAHVRYNHVGVYKCAECEVPFVKLKDLKQHVYTIHSVNRRYMCSLCNIYFKNGSSLRSHIKKMHTSN